MFRWRCWQKKFPSNEHGHSDNDAIIVEDAAISEAGGLSMLRETYGLIGDFVVVGALVLVVLVLAGSRWFVVQIQAIASVT